MDETKKCKRRLSKQNSNLRNPTTTIRGCFGVERMEFSVRFDRGASDRCYSCRYYIVIKFDFSDSTGALEKIRNLLFQFSSNSFFFLYYEKEIVLF